MKERLMSQLCELVEVESVTHSNEEKLFPSVLVEQIKKIDYFQSHPEHIQMTPVQDGRCFVSAFVRSPKETSQTIILISHFDVVDVEDYGSLKELAFKPIELTKHLYSNPDLLPEAIRKEISDDEWLFGRGTMDMKCGIVLHVDLLRKASEGRFSGNLLLLTVPDEEVDSVGMREAVTFLSAFQEQEKLDYSLVLNGEPIFSKQSMDQGRHFYIGSIGKALAGVYCYGKATHVGEPFEGLNSALMLSILTKNIELNTTFVQEKDTEKTQPPTVLYHRDIKEGYSVQIPSRAVAYFNMFLAENNFSELMEHLREVCMESAREIEDIFTKRIQAYYGRGTTYEQLHSPIKVVTIEELEKEALLRFGNKINELKDAIFKREDLDDRESTIKYVDELAKLMNHLSPMIILFFAPPYYPAVYSNDLPWIHEISDELIETAREQHGITLTKQLFFPGLCDLSYVQLKGDESLVDPLVNNMPKWGQGYSLPLKEIRNLNIPVFNLGPLGRDAHKWTERLNVTYSLEFLPAMLEWFVEKVFAKDK